MRKIKETIDCYNDTRMAAKCVAAWLYNQAGLEYDARNYEEGDWFHEKHHVVYWMEDDYSHATSDLFRKFQRDLMRDTRDHSD